MGNVPFQPAVGLQFVGQINDIFGINLNTSTLMRDGLHAIVVIVVVHRFGLGKFVREFFWALDIQIRLHDFFHGMVGSDPRTQHHPATGGEIEAQLDIEAPGLLDRVAEKLPPLGALIRHAGQRRGTGISAVADQVDAADSFCLELLKVAGDARFVHAIEQPKPIHTRFGKIGGGGEILFKIPFRQNPCSGEEKNGCNQRKRKEKAESPRKNAHR